jgi:hypothetical protein
MMKEYMSTYSNDLVRSYLSTSENPLSVVDLGRLQAILRQADVSNFLRHQPICVIEHGSSKPLPVRREYYLSAQALQECLLPDSNLHGNPWLYRHLTMTFDRRVLAQIDDFLTPGLSKPLHFNINLRSVLSQYFRRSLSKLERYSSKLVFEIDLIDILAHPDAYVYASDLLRGSGFSLCVDNINTLCLRLFSFNDLDADQIKIFWSDDMGRCLEKASFKAWLSVQNPNKVILAHCDTPDALEAGHNVGICLFQGKYIDDMISREQPLY